MYNSNDTIGLVYPICPHCNEEMSLSSLEFEDTDENESRTVCDCDICGNQIEIIVRKIYDTYILDD